MSELRIFSYLPNPRLWKATIAARLCGVDVEIRGAAPKALESWLWDFDARPLTGADGAVSADVRIGRTGFEGVRLRKTDAFLEAHPFGSVPAAFSPDGTVGIFESNSIMRAVARLGQARFPLYGGDAYEASRIDGFLDAGLVFARDAQSYLLSLLGAAVTADVQARARESLTTYLAGTSRALASPRRFFVGEDVTLADICFAAEIGLLWNERARASELRAKGLEPILGAALADPAHANAVAHFARLRRHPAFMPDMEPYLAKVEAIA